MTINVPSFLSRKKSKLVSALMIATIFFLFNDNISAQNPLDAKTITHNPMGDKSRDDMDSTYQIQSITDAHGMVTSTQKMKSGKEFMITYPSQELRNSMSFDINDATIRITEGDNVFDNVISIQVHDDGSLSFTVSDAEGNTRNVVLSGCGDVWICQCDDIVPDSSCSQGNGSAGFCASNRGYWYHINETGDTVSYNRDADNQEAGKYTVIQTVITNEGDTCVNTIEYTIPDISRQLAIVIDSSGNECGPSIQAYLDSASTSVLWTLTSSRGDTIHMSGDTIVLDDDFTDTFMNGDYKLQVTDGDGCEAVDSFSIDRPCPIKVCSTCDTDPTQEVEDTLRVQACDNGYANISTCLYVDPNVDPNCYTFNFSQDGPTWNRNNMQDSTVAQGHDVSLPVGIYNYIVGDNNCESSIPVEVVACDTTTNVSEQLDREDTDAYINHDNLVITMGSNMSATYSLINPRGKKEKQGNIGGSISTINVSNVPSGLHIVIINIENEPTKIIKVYKP